MEEVDLVWRWYIFILIENLLAPIGETLSAVLSNICITELQWKWCLFVLNWLERDRRDDDSDGGNHQEMMSHRGPRQNEDDQDDVASTDMWELDITSKTWYFYAFSGIYGFLILSKWETKIIQN